VDAKHNVLEKKLAEEVNSSKRIEVEKQLTEKRENVSSFEIFKFFFAKFLTRRMTYNTNNFLKI
jgi:hypothetical protein